MHRCGVVENEQSPLVRRAKEYLKAIGPAVEGHGGDVHTFKAACALIRGFNLSDKIALSLLNTWNQTCSPPWKSNDLEAKLRSAAENGSRAWGYLQDSSLLCRDDGQVIEEFLKAQSILHWRGQWFEWGQHCWEERSELEVQRQVKAFLKRVREPGASSDTSRPLKISERKIAGLINLLKVEVTVEGDAPLRIQFDHRIPNRVRTTLDVHKGSVISVDNGILEVDDIKSGCVELKKADRALFVPHTLGIRFDPAAECPTFEAYIKDKLQDDADAIRLLQQWFGYVVLGYNQYRKLLVLEGPSTTGKSTILKVMQKLAGGIGSGCVATSLHQLGSAHGLQNLPGAILATIDDASMTGRDSSTLHAMESIKTIVNSGTAVAINPKHEKIINAVIDARFVIATNDPLSWPDHAGAMAERTLYLPLTKTHAGEKHQVDLDKELEDELPGILNWAIAGLEDLLNSGGFCDADVAVSQASKRSHACLNSSVEDWVNNDCNLIHTDDAGREVFTCETIAYKAYESFTKTTRQSKPLSKKKWKLALETKHKVKAVRPQWGIERPRLLGGLLLDAEGEGINALDHTLGDPRITGLAPGQRIKPNTPIQDAIIELEEKGGDA